MSLTTLVIFFVVALAIIYTLEWIVTRFFRLSNNTYNWFSRRKRVKAQRQTLEGLMKMNEGDYAKAEKLIGKNAKHSAEPVLNPVSYTHLIPAYKVAAKCQSVAMPLSKMAKFSCVRSSVKPMALRLFAQKVKVRLKMPKH